MFLITQLIDTGAVLFRQCALAALRDVKSYLKDEGGQVAVSFPTSCFFFGGGNLPIHKILHNILPLLPGLRCHKHNKRKAEHDPQFWRRERLQGRCRSVVTATKGIVKFSPHPQRRRFEQCCLSVRRSFLSSPCVTTPASSRPTSW